MSAPRPIGRIGEGTNLHALWDRRLLQRQHLDDDAYFDRLQAMSLAVPLARDPLPPDAAAWAEASCRIVLQPGVYPARPKLDEAYFISWTPVAEAQLRRAGTRLAQLLNAALAS